MREKLLFIAPSEGLNLVGADGQLISPAFFSGEDVVLHDLATSVATACNESDAPEVLVLDLHLRFRDKEYVDASGLGGVALLKFLRLMDVRQHVVLLSPMSLLELLQVGPAQYIVASPGVTVAPHQYNVQAIEEAIGLPMPELAGRRGPETDDLRNFIKPGIALPKDAKHDWANWWGMYRVILEARSYRNGPVMTVPKPLQEKLKDLKSAELSFAYEADTDVQQGLDFPFLRCSRTVLVDDQAKEGWGEVLERLFSACRSRSSLPAVKVVEPAPGELADHRACEVFYEKQLRPLILGDGEDDFVADLLILDLRLDPEMDSRAAIEGRTLSGLSLLEVLREAHPGLAILAFTASRDPQVHAQLLAFGADRIWVKPGLDLHPSQDDRPKAVPALIDAINVLGSYDHELLHRFGEFQRRVLAEEGNFWWRSHTFENGDGTYHDTSESFAKPRWVEAFHGILQAGLVEFRALLQDHAGQNRAISPLHAQRMAGLISRLGLLVDFIQFGGKRINPSMKTVYDVNEPAVSRNDLIGWLLVVFAVQASRVVSSRSTHPTTFRLFMEVLLDYLDAEELPTASAAHYPLRDVFPLVWKSPWWYVSENATLMTEDLALASYVQGKNIVDHTKAILMKER